jgi:hypothetical protein
MQQKVITAFPEVTLGRILDALECELIEASDAEILEAAQDLGMNPAMRGSAAFFGLKYPAPGPRFEDFFALPAGPETQLAVERLLAERLGGRIEPAPEAPQPPGRGGGKRKGK